MWVLIDVMKVYARYMKKIIIAKNRKKGAFEQINFGWICLPYISNRWQIEIDDMNDVGLIKDPCLTPCLWNYDNSVVYCHVSTGIALLL